MTLRALLKVDPDSKPSVVEYKATAYREGKFWVVDVPGVGVTQGTDWTYAQDMAVHLVAITKQVPPETVIVTLTVRDEPMATTDEDGQPVPGRND